GGGILLAVVIDGEGALDRGAVRELRFPRHLDPTLGSGFPDIVLALDDVRARELGLLWIELPGTHHAVGGKRGGGGQDHHRETCGELLHVRPFRGTAARKLVSGSAGAAGDGVSVPRTLAEGK